VSKYANYAIYANMQFTISPAQEANVLSLVLSGRCILVTIALTKWLCKL